MRTENRDSEESSKAIMKEKGQAKVQQIIVTRMETKAIDDNCSHEKNHASQDLVSSCSQEILFFFLNIGSERWNLGTYSCMTSILLPKISPQTKAKHF